MLLILNRGMQLQCLPVSSTTTSSTQNPAPTKKDAPYLPPPYERAYAHPSSLTGRSNSCRGIRPRKVETLGACKPLRAQCPEEDLFSQWGPTRLFPASSVFSSPSPGIAPLYSRPLWERKPLNRDWSPPWEHTPLLTYSGFLYIYIDSSRFIPPKTAPWKKKKSKARARGQKKVMSALMCFMNWC